MMLSHLDPARTLHLDAVRRELAAAAHGAKGAIVQRAAGALGVSPQTVHRWLGEHLHRQTGRKRRSDAGIRSVEQDDLEKIGAALLATFRRNGKRIMTFETAVQMLRDNGELQTDLSAARLATILTERGLHPSQMTRPEPCVEQRSLHPNHVWQVDASVCVAYYLSNATGLCVMDEKAFYKNKPGNLTRIQEERLIRYTAADHRSHELLTRYYLGSECAKHLADFLIWAFAEKPGRHVMHGVPFIVEMDMGSANTSAPVLNLLERLDVRVIVHERHNSRANGSVEKGHDLVERHFESALRFARVAGLEDLNDKALAWANHYGATRIHTRYGRTRHAMWLTIAAEQLRIAPPADLMRELVTTLPKRRRVDNNLRIDFAVRGHGSHDYDLRYVPGVMAGRWVEVVVNPFRLPAINVAYAEPESGVLRWITVEPVARDEAGFRVGAPVKGEELRAAPRSVLEANRDRLLVRTYSPGTELAAGEVPMRERAAAAAKLQEGGALAFGGKVDPFKTAAEADLPAFIAKRGVPLDAPAPTVEAARLNPVQASGRVRAALARRGLEAAYDARAVFAHIEREHGQAGLPEDQVDALAGQIAAQYMSDHAQPTGTAGGGLRIVGGA